MGHRVAGARRDQRRPAGDRDDRCGVGRPGLERRVPRDVAGLDQGPFPRPYDHHRTRARSVERVDGGRDVGHLVAVSDHQCRIAALDQGPRLATHPHGRTDPCDGEERHDGLGGRHSGHRDGVTLADSQRTHQPAHRRDLLEQHRVRDGSGRRPQRGRFSNSRHYQAVERVVDDVEPTRRGVGRILGRGEPAGSVHGAVLPPGPGPGSRAVEGRAHCGVPPGSL